LAQINGAQNLAPPDPPQRSRPRPPQTTREVLEAYRDLLCEHDELRALLSRLAPAWIELRNVLKELSVLGG